MSKHVAIFEELVQPGKWFRFPQALVAVCKGDHATALLLAYLLAKQGYHGPWFWCPVSKIEEDLCMNLDKRCRSQKKLKSLGLLEVKKEKGRIPTRNLYRVDTEQVVELVLASTAKVGQNDTGADCKSASSTPCESAKSIELADLRGLSERQDRENRELSGVSQGRLSPPMSEHPTDTSGQYEIEKGDRMFFNDLAPPQGNEAHLALATRLRDAVRQRWQGSAKAPSLAKWAKDFAKLERQQNFSRILAVFEWYLDHMGDEFVPVVKSASSFYAKWDGLVAAYDRDPKNTPVSPLAMKIVTKLDEQGHTWPKGARERLPHAVDKWLDWVEETKSRVSEWQAVELPAMWDKYGYHVSSAIVRPMWALMYGRLIHANRAVAEVHHALAKPEAFVLLWFRQYHRKVSGWADWSGRFENPSLTDLKKLPNYARKANAFDHLIEQLTTNEDTPQPPTRADLARYNATKRPLPKA